MATALRPWRSQRERGAATLALLQLLTLPLLATTTNLTLPVNRTAAANLTAGQLDAMSTTLQRDALDVTACLRSACTEALLNNGACDAACDTPECDHDMGHCHRFFDYHGYGWNFAACEKTGCKRALLYNSVCDDSCSSAVCHWDNWRCNKAFDANRLYDRHGYAWDRDLADCYAGGCTEALLFNGKCDGAKDKLCNVNFCHFDNWACEQPETPSERAANDAADAAAAQQGREGGSDAPSLRQEL